MNHTQNLSLEFTKNKDVSVDITTQTIDSCCNTIDTKLEQEGHDFLKLMTHDLDEADKLRQKTNDAAWVERKRKVTASHMQLVKTNSIAIKNNAIIEDKLQLADATIHS